MPVLDPRTVDRLAELICDRDGPHERSVRQLSQFLSNAGWTVDYAGGGREPWLAETIRQHNDDAQMIESLLRRMIDPREYDEGLQAAQQVLSHLNPLLVADGIQLDLDGHRPVLRGANDGPDLSHVADRLAGPELRTLVRELVSNAAMAEILIQRLDEVEACRGSGAYLMAVVGTGSFIEGLLHDALWRRDSEFRTRINPSLAELLQRAKAKGWIDKDAYQFSELVRDYRNFVHPREQLDLAFSPDNDTVLMCWQPVLAIMNDLDARLPGRGSNPR